MSLLEAEDFLAECEALHQLAAAQDETRLQTRTQFKGWSVEDVLVHLHFWNRAADLSLTDEAAFQDLLAKAGPALRSGQLRALENSTIAQRGVALLDAWIAQARDMANRWRSLDPKLRLPWAGPSMSARSSITARQMETWAHGFEVFDAFGTVRQESDRIKNIVVLGVNTFGWSHKVNGLEIPEKMPLLRLLAPSGAIWSFGDLAAGEILGPAADFAAVVSQTRAVADTQLTVRGAVAATWMAHAQCFAGPAEQPPSPQSRFMSVTVRN